VRARLFAARLFALVPKEGLFPAWAYFGLPLLAVVVTGVLAFLFARSHSRPVPVSAEPVVSSETASFAESAAAPPREIALEVGGLDGAGWRMNLRNAAREKDWSKGVGAVRALARVDAAALRERDAQTSIRNLAVGLSQEGGDLYDSFFDWLAGEAGQDGLDVLFDIARFRPATKAGKRAVEALRRPEIVTNASPALKVLIDFREASCVAQQDLFGRMSQQGDERALLELTILRDGECSRRRDPCCYKENRALAAAIRTLRGRLTPASPPSSPPSPPTPVTPAGSVWMDAPR
jgi:serine/threonine-protein kinase